MNPPVRAVVAMAALGVAAVVLAETSLVEAPDPQSVASGVWLIPGGIRPNRQPDGNSVVFEAPEGLVVIDTGRHAWHREAILSLARAQRKDVVAIVNTHWHLDHVSGNPDLRAAYPQVRVHASSAIDGALTGFLPASAADSAAYLDDPEIPEETREDIRADLLTIQNGGALKPDVVIAASGTTALGGLALRISLVPDAVTAGDVWIYDSARRVAVLGDLVTLPAPFLDTACPQGWKAALDAVAATPFEVAIPGHGAPMSRAQFLLYQAAFEAFIDCSGSTATGDECAARWANSIRPLLGEDVREHKQARGMAASYVDLLRANGGRSRHCAVAPPLATDACAALSRSSLGARFGSQTS
jgi:glyoxylase-like metal-dependent hydrolase (beta-lactamase superfamily II)